MSEDQKAREETQPLPQQAPAAYGSKDTKEDQNEQQHSFRDWAAI